MSPLRVDGGGPYFLHIILARKRSRRQPVAQPGHWPESWGAAPTIAQHLTRDGRLLFATRFVRLFAYGGLSVVLTTCFWTGFVGKDST